MRTQTSVSGDPNETVRAIKRSLKSAITTTGAEKQEALEAFKAALDQSVFMKPFKDWNDNHKISGYPFHEFEADLNRLLAAGFLTEYHASVLRQLKNTQLLPRGNGDTGARLFKDVSTMPVREVLEMTSLFTMATDPLNREPREISTAITELTQTNVQIVVRKDDVLVNVGGNMNHDDAGGSTKSLLGWIRDVFIGAAAGTTVGLIILPVSPLAGAALTIGGAMNGAAQHEMNHAINDGFMTDPNDPDNPCNKDPFILC